MIPTPRRRNVVLECLDRLFLRDYGEIDDRKRQYRGLSRKRQSLGNPTRNDLSHRRVLESKFLIVLSRQVQTHPTSTVGSERALLISSTSSFGFAGRIGWVPNCFGGRGGGKRFSTAAGGKTGGWMFGLNYSHQEEEGRLHLVERYIHLNYYRETTLNPAAHAYAHCNKKDCETLGNTMERVWICEIHACFRCNQFNRYESAHTIAVSISVVWFRCIPVLKDW